MNHLRQESQPYEQQNTEPEAADVDIMWPSSTTPVQQQPSWSSRQEQQQVVVSNVTKRTRSGYYKRQNTDSLGDIDEEVDDNASGIQYNNTSKPDYTSYNFEKDTSSGLERDIHRQSTNEGSKSNRWMRQSSAQLDIDELPLPTAEEGPKTFEQLLAEKMEAD